ncbi:MAG TPA: serine hydrolase domain-containing protein [Gemmatimonadaceae bacterium]|nr:serine hydrolase domain-containing protein [Gemmatimonadaceae bacterium]
MRNTACFSGLLALLLLPGVLTAQSATTAPSARVVNGFDVNRLSRIDQALQGYVDRNEIAGSVALVLHDGRPVYQKAVGWADKDARKPMTMDAIFRIASQTKAITSTAVLMLFEEGKIALSDPVSRFIPQFAHTSVATRADTGRVITPAKREITIHDLLTHTSGISYGTDSIVAALYAAKGLGPSAGWGWYTADKNESVCTTMERLASLPFVAQPGEKWVYGYNLDVLGCVIERASGIPFDQFVRTRITEPLGMRDTFFFIPAEKKQQLVTVYMNDSAGRLQKAPESAKGQGHYVEGPRKNFSGGAGLLSTAHDYGRFLQMLANGGQLDGVRILAPRTVMLMTTNQSDTLFKAFSPCAGFGLGFGTHERVGCDELASVGSYYWGGAYGSSYMVDPREHLVIMFMENRLPRRSQVGDNFRNLVYQALVEP